ncbi:glycosyltransferase involved in cell wall biosynthesis [Nakamurella sp. UYEF19]|uniref:glycosyltransferase family 2 protein n=1 Tax=Nakamurella sp. UYEF19 TaxID=1756392 RepID=UPI0033970182
MNLESCDSTSGTGRLGPTVGPSVDLILPCLDEAAALPAVFAAVPASYRVILVDNGSRDGSADVATSLGARVVVEERKGYGSAVNAGLLAATADIVAVLDCDGSLDPAELPTLVAAVAEGTADLALGRRRPVESGAWPWHARTGNRVLASVLSRSVPGLTLTDLGPVRVARRVELLALDVRDRRSGYPVETLIRAAMAGWRIQEHDMTYRTRALGTTSKVSGSVRGTVVATGDILRTVRRHRVAA